MVGRLYFTNFMVTFIFVFIALAGKAYGPKKIPSRKEVFLSMMKHDSLLQLIKKIYDNGYQEYEFKFIKEFIEQPWTGLEAANINLKDKKTVYSITGFASKYFRNYPAISKKNIQRKIHRGKSTCPKKAPPINNIDKNFAQSTGILNTKKPNRKMQSRRNSFSRYSSKYPNLNISYEIRQELTIALQEATIKPNETNLKRIIEALRQAFAHVLSNELPKLDFLTNDKYIDEWTQFLLQNTDGKILSKYLKTEGVSIKRDIFHIRIFRNRKVLREKLVYYFRSEQSKGLEIEKIWYTFFMNPSSYNSRLKPATHG